MHTLPHMNITNTAETSLHSTTNVNEIHDSDGAMMEYYASLWD